MLVIKVNTSCFTRQRRRGSGSEEEEHDDVTFVSVQQRMSNRFIRSQTMNCSWQHNHTLKVTDDFISWATPPVTTQWSVGIPGNSKFSSLSPIHLETWSFLGCGPWATIVRSRDTRLVPSHLHSQGLDQSTCGIVCMFAMNLLYMACYLNSKAPGTRTSPPIFCDVQPDACGSRFPSVRERNFDFVFGGRPSPAEK